MHGLLPTADLRDRRSCPSVMTDPQAHEIGAATRDVHVCNLPFDNSVRALKVPATLIDGVAPGGVERHAAEHGGVVDT